MDMPEQNSFLCLLCELDCNSNDELNLHMQIHNAAKPYFCSECEKRYTYKNALKSHMESHRLEKPVKTANTNVMSVTPNFDLRMP